MPFSDEYIQSENIFPDVIHDGYFYRYNLINEKAAVSFISEA